MTILQTGVSLPLNLKAGETLVIKELSGTSTVTGSVASREDASASIGAGFYSYGPQSADCSVTITTTGTCDWVVRVGDATPATGTIKTQKSATGQTVLDDASWAAMRSSGFGVLPPYIGQVANRCSHANKNNTTNKQLMSRSRHNAMVSINHLALVFWNGFTDFDGTKLETGGGAATYTASIEYPSGTIAAQVTWGGSTSKNAADNEVFRSDFANVNIPKGAVFFVRVWRSSTTGIIYNKFGGLLDTEAVTTYSGECFTYSTTTADLTMTPGQFTNIGNTGTGFRPQAIVSLTSTPSVVLFGDSRVNNDNQNDTVTDGFGYVGELERSIGMQHPTIKLSQSSERLYQALSRFTYRMQIAAYCSHGVSNYGVNDFRDSRTAAQLLADHKTFAASFGKPYYVCTVAPMANAGNTVTDATVNPLRTAYNAIIRKGDESFAGTLEIADIVETARDSGLWISGYTSDGLHANTTGSLALQRSGSLTLPL